ncbi:MAG: protocatechuate 3,4-dioxygenase subunit alpha [Xanthobacteraceae bacterium]|nr:protocatechuate 3,4-dioxygenase subunit alpha [Xanthobacteraceae bacterium]MCW5674083.1 protocatechuate 3,4-dioxygenase subunit alpha [Xanthobacteraceae bacterium]
MIVSKQRLGQTPSQTVGPFFHYALPYENDSNLIVGDAQGQRIVVEGKVTDGNGDPVPDVMIEIWQANATGKYDHPEDTQNKPVDPGFHGFGRCATDKDGIFRFNTVKPGAVPGPGNSLQAPHLVTFVFGRGMLKQLLTRIYFEDEAHNADDPVLNLVPEARRPTLVARKAGASTYRLDIVLQGEGETVFFDY